MSTLGQFKRPQHQPRDERARGRCFAHYTLPLHITNPKHNTLFVIGLCAHASFESVYLTPAFTSSTLSHTVLVDVLLDYKTLLLWWSWSLEIPPFCPPLLFANTWLEDYVVGRYGGDICMRTCFNPACFAVVHYLRWEAVR